MRFGPQFYSLPTLDLAKALLGAKLCTMVRGKLTAGMIVEVEAYSGHNDSACHASRGRTFRNAVMFKSPGHVYVYFIYGMHFCVNVVSDEEGVGSAVLIRAIEPTDGLNLMMTRRQAESRALLANGPGKLCKALAIGKSLNAHHLATSKNIWIEPYREVSDADILQSPRIGISSARSREWRFFLKNNMHVSGSRRVREG